MVNNRATIKKISIVILLIIAGAMAISCIVTASLYDDTSAIHDTKPVYVIEAIFSCVSIALSIKLFFMEMTFEECGRLYIICIILAFLPTVISLFFNIAIAFGLILFNLPYFFFSSLGFISKKDYKCIWFLFAAGCTTLLFLFINFYVFIPVFLYAVAAGFTYKIAPSCCDNCGADLRKYHKFCTKCGAKNPYLK